MCLLIARREFEASANRLLLDLQRGAAGAASALRDLRSGVGASTAALDSLSKGMSDLHEEQRRQSEEHAQRAAEALLRVGERAEGARLSAERAARGGETILSRQSALRDLISGIERSQADRASEASARAERLAEAVARAAFSAEAARQAQETLVSGVRELREGASTVSEMLRRSLNYQRRLESVLHARLFGRLERGGGRFYLGSAAATAAAAAFGPERVKSGVAPAAVALVSALSGELALDAVSSIRCGGGGGGGKKKGGGEKRKGKRKKNEKEIAREIVNLKRVLALFLNSLCLQIDSFFFNFQNSSST